MEGLGFRVEGLGFWGHRYRTLHPEVFLKLSWGSLRRDLELTLDQYRLKSMGVCWGLDFRVSCALEFL